MALDLLQTEEIAMAFHRITGSAAALLLAGMAPANAASPLVTIKASGDRGWSLVCTFEREGKGPVERKAGRGRKSAAFAVRAVNSGRCDYAASGNGALTLRFLDEGDTERCPLTRVEDHCLRTVAPAEKGSFDF